MFDRHDGGAERLPDAVRLLLVQHGPGRVVGDNLDRRAERSRGVVEDVTGATVEPKRGAAVHPRRRPVDDRHLAARLQRRPRKVGNRIDLERGADDKE